MGIFTGSPLTGVINGTNQADVFSGEVIGSATAYGAFNALINARNGIDTIMLRGKASASAGSTAIGYGSYNSTVNGGNGNDTITIIGQTTEHLAYEQQNYSSGSYTGSQIVDLDQDGKLEVLVGHRDTNALEIWKYNSSTNALSLSQSITFSFQVHDFQVADFNHDGNLDIVAGLRFDGLYYVKNNGDGTWSSPTLIDYLYSWKVQTADFNKDGNLDIFEGVDGFDGIKIFYGNGDGTFAAGMAPTLGSSGHSTTVVDLNKDGFPDIVGVSGNKLKTFINKRDGTWAALTPVSVPESRTGLYALGNIIAGDLNSDGYVDVVAVNPLGSNRSDPTDVVVFWGREIASNLTWMPQVIDSVPGETQEVGIADVNDDGEPDIFVRGPVTNIYYDPPPVSDKYLNVYLNKGNNSFSKQNIYDDSAGIILHNVAFGDINGDSTSDVVVANAVSDGGGFSILFQNKPTGIGAYQSKVNGDNGDDIITISGTNFGIKNSLITGGNGNDTFNVGTGQGTITGGRGRDTLIIDYFKLDPITHKSTNVTVSSACGKIFISGLTDNLGSMFGDNGHSNAWKQTITGIEQFVVDGTTYCASKFVDIFG